MNNFEKTVVTIPDIANGYCKGLGALGADSSYVSVKYTRLIDGSVDIDSCTKELYPASNRWDYVVSYDGRAYYFEVHPATEGEVKMMEAKLKWLKGWLKQNAQPLDEYPSGTPQFTWVHSGKCGLAKGSKEYWKVAMLGLVLKNRLSLE
ncbi:MAG: hypothetical protein IKX59_03440 [Bacteroidales bacterium]|nr:hypothetical protein [Bacteroidales bacterium]